MNATQTVSRSIHAVVTEYEGAELVAWDQYVADRLAAEFPGREVDVSYGPKNRLDAWTEEEAEAEGGLLEGLTFSQLLSTWWDELCNDVNNPAWTA